MKYRFRKLERNVSHESRTTVSRIIAKAVACGNCATLTESRAWTLVR